MPPIRQKRRRTKWEYILCDALDPNLKKIGLITEARSRKLDIVHNRPGSCGFTVPLNGRWAPQIKKHSTAVKVKRNGVTIWSGPVFTRSMDAASNTMEVGCLGWLEELYARLIRPGQETSLIFNSAQVGSEAYNIIYKLLEAANKQRTGVPQPITIINPDGTHGDPTKPLRPTRIIQGDATLTDLVNFPAWPKFSVNHQKWAVIGNSIQAVSDVENGVDLWIDPDTRELHVYYPRRGVIRQAFFGYGKIPNNLKNVTRQEDGRRGVQRFNVLGRYGVSVAEDEDAMNALGMMIEEQASLNDVTNGDILLAYAGAEVAVRSHGLITDTISLHPRSDDPRAVRVPALFEDYDVGDFVHVSADKGELQFNKQQMRVYSVSLRIDEQNNEIIDSISTAPPNGGA